MAFTTGSLAQRYTVYFVSKTKVELRNNTKQKVRLNKKINKNSFVKIALEGVMTVKDEREGKVYVFRTPVNGKLSSLLESSKAKRFSANDRKLAKLNARSTFMQTEGAAHRGDILNNEDMIIDENTINNIYGMPSKDNHKHLDL